MIAVIWQWFVRSQKWEASIALFLSFSLSLALLCFSSSRMRMIASPPIGNSRNASHRSTNQCYSYFWPFSLVALRLLLHIISHRSNCSTRHCSRQDAHVDRDDLWLFHPWEMKCWLPPCRVSLFLAITTLRDSHSLSTWVWSLSKRMERKTCPFRTSPDRRLRPCLCRPLVLSNRVVSSFTSQRRVKRNSSPSSLLESWTVRMDMISSRSKRRDLLNIAQLPNGILSSGYVSVFW